MPNVVQDSGSASGIGSTIVDYASTANVNTATELTNGTAFGGGTLVTGQKVLLKDQTTQSQNGIYIVPASGAASRDSSWGAGSDGFGKVVTIRLGTSAGTSYLETASPAIVNTNPLVFTAQGAGAVAEYGEQEFGTATQQVLAAAAADITGSTFTLPSAGVWEVEYKICVYANSLTQPTISISTLANVDVPRSQGVFRSTNSTSAEFVQATGRAVITTTAATQYKLRGLLNPGTLGGVMQAPVGSGINKITWRKISGNIPIASSAVIAAEFGEQTMAANLNVTTTATDVISFTLPSAGTWDVEYTLYPKITGINHTASAWISDNANTYVANSSSYWEVPTGNAANSSLGALTNRARIVTTGAATYKIRAVSNAQNFQIVSDTVAPQVGKCSKVSWIKIAGAAATSVTLARVVANTLSATGTAGAGTAITAGIELLDTTNSFNPATGVFTAPRTGRYQVSLQLFAAATAAAGSRFGVILSTNGAGFGSGNPIISCYCFSANPSNVAFGGSYIKLLNAGDQLTCRLFNDAATACNLSANANFDYININELPNTTWL